MSLLDRAIVGTLPLVPKALVRRFAAPYIAGEKLEHMVAAVRKLNSEGCMATVDLLGEFITRFEQAEETRAGYERILDAIEAEKLDANISIKLTAFGLNLDEARCRGLVESLFESARRRNIFLRVDMESSKETDRTLALFHGLHEAHPGRVGVVVQAYLRRTMEDLDRLIAVKGNIRLCKGIYVESPAIAYKDRDIIRENFADLMDRWLASGLYMGIATHDEWVVQKALAALKRHNVPRDRYEFQMLLGVVPALRRHLVEAGHRLRVYVPFGKDWYGYSTRRLKENPAVARYVFLDLLRPRSKR